MAQLTPEALASLGSAQLNLWGPAAESASQAFGIPISLETPLALATSTEEVLKEIQGPMLILEFSFQGMETAPHLLLVPTDVAKRLLSAVAGGTLEEIPEELTEDLKQPWRGFVEGLSQGLAQVRSSPAPPIASFHVEHRVFSLPPALEATSDLLRVQVTIDTGDLSGSLTWLLSTESAVELFSLDKSLAFADESTSGSWEPSSEGSIRDLNLLLDIPLNISVELGRASLLLQDVLDLAPGSVVELDKAAGEPVDVLVNGRLVARGEVVVIEDNFGIRITEIVSPQERVHRLGEAA
jgi:flagellar motor switch protein FliN/FliY